MIEAKEMILADAVSVAIKAEHEKIKLKKALFVSVLINILLLIVVWGMLWIIQS